MPGRASPKHSTWDVVAALGGTCCPPPMHPHSQAAGAEVAWRCHSKDRAAGVAPCCCKRWPLGNTNEGCPCLELDIGDDHPWLRAHRSCPLTTLPPLSEAVGILGPLLPPHPQGHLRKASHVLNQTAGWELVVVVAACTASFLLTPCASWLFQRHQR